MRTIYRFLGGCMTAALLTLPTWSVWAQDRLRIAIVDGVGSQQSFADLEVKYKPATDLVAASMGRKSSRVRIWDQRDRPFRHRDRRFREHYRSFR